MTFNISNKLSVIFILLAMSLLSGCASLMDSLTPVETASIYDLVPVKAARLGGPKVEFNLSISEPKSTNILSGEKVLVRPSPVIVQYYENIIWSDSITRLVHRRVIQAFEDSRRVVSVGARSDGFDTQYDLVMEIRDFHIEPSPKVVDEAIIVDGQVVKPLRVKVSIFAKLIDEKAAQVVKSARISRTVEIEVESRENIALAFNQAFEKVAVSLVYWTLKS